MTIRKISIVIFYKKTEAHRKKQWASVLLDRIILIAANGIQCR